MYGKAFAGPDFLCRASAPHQQPPLAAHAPAAGFLGTTAASEIEQLLAGTIHSEIL